MQKACQTVRTLFHVDMDAFFASVEIVQDPSLRGKPVIIAGDPSKRGVVSTCSYEARAYGVHSAMSAGEAKRRCPHGIFLSGNHALYREVSEQVMGILRSLTDEVEAVSIDEAYLDISELATEKAAKQIGIDLRRQIFDETQLTCSIGLASNKLVAKVASGIAKPNGLLEVPSGMEAEFLAWLPVGKIPGIGSKTQELFRQDDIETIEDLQALTLDVLTYRYGMRGYHFHQAAFGIDNRPVISTDGPPKSIGAETTFEKDIDTLEEIADQLDIVLEKAFNRLERKKMRAQGLTLKMRDSGFHTITRSKTFPTHTHEKESLRQNAHQLLRHSWGGEPLRLIGVSFDKLTDGYWQPLLWPWEEG